MKIWYDNNPIRINIQSTYCNGCWFEGAGVEKRQPITNFSLTQLMQSSLRSSRLNNPNKNEFTIYSQPAAMNTKRRFQIFAWGLSSKTSIEKFVAKLWPTGIKANFFLWFFKSHFFALVIWSHENYRTYSVGHDNEFLLLLNFDCTNFKRKKWSLKGNVNVNNLWCVWTKFAVHSI